MSKLSERLRFNGTTDGIAAADRLDALEASHWKLSDALDNMIKHALTGVISRAAVRTAKRRLAHARRLHEEDDNE